jgi:hypothetical protein
MKPILILGTSIVNLALISYSIAVITEQRRHVLSSKVPSYYGACGSSEVQKAKYLKVFTGIPAWPISGG